MAQMTTRFFVGNVELAEGLRVVLTQTDKHGAPISKPTPAIVTVRGTPARPMDVGGELGFSFDLADPTRGEWRPISAPFGAHVNIEITEG